MIAAAKRLKWSLERRLAERRWPAWLRRTMAVEGWLSEPEAQALYRLAGEVANGCIVEIGSYRGRSTVALSAGVEASGRDTPIFAVDPHETFEGPLGGSFGPPDRAAFFRTMLDTRAFERVRLVNLSSEVITAGWTKPVGLLWIDGDHAEAATRRDLAVWEPHLTPDAVVCFHDVTPGTGPTAVTDELAARGRYEPIFKAHRLLAMRRAAATHQLAEPLPKAA